MEYPPTVKIINRVSILLILAGSLRIFPENGTELHDLFINIQLLGFSFYLLSYSWLKKNNHISKSAIFILGIVLLPALSIQAQDADYKIQVDALKQSFADKNIAPVKPYISPLLSFFTYPAGATQQILAQVFANLPALNEIEITESRDGEALVYYNFTALGERNSKILFGADGKITKIELIDNLLEEQAKAQAALAKQVQSPSPGELGEKYPPQKVEFSSKDGLIITGNLYEVDSSGPIILLCHSGGGNKYEYADIAPKLNAKGFNALAIDQRSGAIFAGKPNETHERAKADGLSTEFIDAEQDIRAAIGYLADRYGRKVTLWGSSYSAALSLYIIEGNDRVNGMILFSPGNYLSGEKGTLKGRLASLDMPYLMTSTLEEAADITNVLLAGVTLSNTQTQHIPSFAGYHGSQALWEGQEGSEEYWDVVWSTLGAIYPKN